MSDEIPIEHFHRLERGCLYAFCLFCCTCVLAAIFVPHFFFETSKRSTVSRMKADMRSLATALESYRTEKGSYPPHTFEDEYKINWEIPLDAPTFDRRFSLSTPITYISKFPKDLFNPQGETMRNGLAYYSNGHGWLLISAGPDRDYDTPFRSFSSQMTYIETGHDGTFRILLGAAAARASLLSYDPTNGAFSNGDIYYFSNMDDSLQWFSSKTKSAEQDADILPAVSDGQD